MSFASRSPATSRSSSFGGGRSRGGREAAPEPDPTPADPVEVARQICLHQLEHAPRTRAELATALRRKSIDDEVAEQVLGRFADVGMIDDAQFAQLWVSSRQRSKGLAGRALSQELRRKGVDDTSIADALATIEPEVELATARALVDRKLRTTANLPTDARVRRLAGMLARKGYPAGLAFRVVREALTAEGEGLDEAWPAVEEHEKEPPPG